MHAPATRATPSTFRIQRGDWLVAVAHGCSRETSRRADAIVVIGDSITDGMGSTPDTNRRSTDVLADRRRAIPARRGVVIVLLGINDIGAPVAETVSAGELIAGYRQLIERAHQRGGNPIGPTLPDNTPQRTVSGSVRNRLDEPIAGDDGRYERPVGAELTETP